MPKAKRILMILENESFPEDTRVLLEARALVEAGYDVTVVCPTGNSKRWSEQVEGTRVYRYPAPWEIDGFIGYVAEFAYSMLAAFLYSLFVLLRHGFDAIHVHTPPDMNMVVAIPFRWLGKKCVMDHHDLSPELYNAQKEGQGSAVVTNALLGFERLACQTADRLIATNQSQQKIQTERGGADVNRCVVVRNGPNEMFLGNVAPHESLRDELRAKIGYVGMIGVQDGVDLFVKSLVELKKRRQDFVGVIVGSGPAIADLRKLVVDEALEDHVEFTGLVEFEEVPSYIAAFDICVTPDPSNPYNDSCTTIKTMEYMALSKPTVAFATRENQITAGDAALYASNNDLDEFTDLIEELIDDPFKRHELGEIGRKRVDEFLSWEQQRHNLIGLYNELFGSTMQRQEKLSDTGRSRTAVSQEV